MILNVLYNPPVKFTVDVELMKLARIDIKFKRHTPYTLYFYNPIKRAHWGGELGGWVVQDTYVNVVCDIEHESRDRMARLVIEKRRERAAKLMHSNFDVHEPAIAIIQKMLTRPKRFEVVRELHEYNPINENNHTNVIVDKDTGVKFVLSYMFNVGNHFHSGMPSSILQPRVFTHDEQKVISHCIAKIVNDTKEAREKLKTARQEARKAKFRDELMQQYCEV